MVDFLFILKPPKIIFIFKQSGHYFEPCQIAHLVLYTSVVSAGTDILAFKLHDVGGEEGLMAIHSLGWYTGGGYLMCAVTQNVPNDWNSKGKVSLHS